MEQMVSKLLENSKFMIIKSVILNLILIVAMFLHVLSALLEMMLFSIRGIDIFRCLKITCHLWLWHLPELNLSFRMS